MDSKATRAKSMIVGAVVGGALGALLRLLVAITFLWYAEHWGASGKFVREADFDVYQLTAISALIGLFIGASAGLTCQPIVGTFVGTIGSACSCYALFVLPLGMFGRFPDEDKAMREIF